MRRSLFLGAALSISFVLVLPALAVLPSVLAGGGCHRAGAVEAVPTVGDSTVVKMDGCTFAPTITRVPVGTVVRFLNSADTYHDVTGRSGWGSDVLDAGEEFSQLFRGPGLYPYSCSLHPGMAGVVIVGSTDAELIPAAMQQADLADADAASAAGVDTAAAPRFAIAGAGAAGLLVGALVTAVVTRRRGAEA